jgi:hypothetical protein
MQVNHIKNIPAFTIPITIPVLQNGKLATAFCNPTIWNTIGKNYPYPKLSQELFHLLNDQHSNTALANPQCNDQVGSL